MGRLKASTAAERYTWEHPPSTDDNQSVETPQTERSSIDGLHYFTNYCFQPEDYVEDPSVMRFHLAARENDVPSIKKSIERGVSVYLPDEVGRSALHWAAVFCKPGAIEAILKQFPKSRLDTGDINGCTPLHYAVLAGRTDAARMLLKAGCRVHTEDNWGRTPLHYAAQNANIVMVLLLVKRGADLTHFDKLKRMPFDVAVEYNNTQKIIECLRAEVPDIVPAQKQLKRVGRHRHKHLSLKAKAIESDGKLSITFLAQNLEEDPESARGDIGSTTGETEVDIPVEIVKERMERDADRMGQKLRKIKTVKKAPSDEKVKKKAQEMALRVLLNRAKKNALKEQRRRWVEEERTRMLAQNRTRNITPPSRSPRSLDEFIVGHFETSRRPSNASSLLDDTEEQEEPEPDKLLQLKDSFGLYRGQFQPASPSVEVRRFNANVNREFGRKATKHVSPRASFRELTSAKANAMLGEHAPRRTSTSFGEMRADARDGHCQAPPQDATGSTRDFPGYVQQWFANAFTYPGIPNSVCRLWNPMGPSSDPLLSPGQMNPNTPPSASAPYTHLGQRTSDEPSLTSPQHVIQADTGAPSGVGQGPSCPPLDRYLRQNISISCPTPYPYEGQWTENPSKAQNPPIASVTGDIFTPLAAVAENLISGTAGCGKLRADETYTNQMSEQNGESEDEDPFTRLGYFHLKKAPVTSFNAPPNRHGYECCTSPSARGKTNKVRAGADYRWSHVQPSQPWSTDEPWRPGGISRTVKHAKLYGALRTKCLEKSIHSIRALVRRTSMQSKTLEEMVNIHVDPLAKSEPQNEALWSLRETPKQTSDSHGNKSATVSCQPQSGNYKPGMSRPNFLAPEDSPDTCPHQKQTDILTTVPTQCRSDTVQLADRLPNEKPPQTISNWFYRPASVDPFQQDQSDPFFYRNTSKQPAMASYPSNAYQQPEDANELPFFHLSPVQPSHTNSPQSSNQQQQAQTIFPDAPDSLYSERSTEQQQSSPSMPSQLPDPLYLCPPNASQTLSSYNVGSIPMPGTMPFRSLHSNPSSPPELATWQQLNFGPDAGEESHFMSSQQDEVARRRTKASRPETFQHITFHENAVEAKYQRQREGKPRSHCSEKIPHSHSSLERLSPERLALMDYYGQSSRPRFLGLSRGQAPVHQCVDLKSLHEQWL